MFILPSGTGWGNIIRHIIYANGYLGVGLQADGKILYLSSFPGYIAPSGAIGRVDTNGTADTGFPTVFLTNGLAYALALDGNNRIILGGSFVAILGQTRPRIARLNADGTLDP